MHGFCELEFGGQRTSVRRDSIFDEAPTALHVGPHTPISVRTRVGDRAHAERTALRSATVSAD
jgi:hypothetical protein